MHQRFVHFQIYQKGFRFLSDTNQACLCLFVNLEASYESYEVLIDHNTEFTGDITSMEKLKEKFDKDDKFDASLWVKDKGKNSDINYKVVTKINILV